MVLLGCVCAATYFPWLQGICLCGLWGSAVSFYAAPLVDPTVYRRMADKNRWTMTEFHVGNLFLHVFPAVQACRVWHATVRDGLRTVVIHATWGIVASRCTGKPPFCLDAVYVPMPHWGLLWVLAWI